ncbi:Lrp/AsnC family transcriptional regulator [Candidatus Woesearchaeota archaeon]|nr:Lrp/AsnC family transcriptional regulator [Candidatus Woesearchaeota archaeon]
MKQDMNMISALRRNGRIQLAELSRRTNVPISTLHERLKQEIAEGVVHPSALLNFGKLGFDTRAYILIGVDPAEKDKLLSYLSKHQNVNSLFRINSGWTTLMECVFKDMYALENFIEGVEKQFTIRQKQVCYVLDELRREAFLSDADLLPGLLGGSFKYSKAKKGSD